MESNFNIDGRLRVINDLMDKNINLKDRGQIGGWEITESEVEKTESVNQVKLEDVIRIISFIRSKYDEDCLDEDCVLSVDYTEGAYDVCNEIIKRLNRKYRKGEGNE